MSCAWCGAKAEWIVKDNKDGHGITRFCNRCYGSHARSPLAKGIRIKTNNTQGETK